ncbi:MAG: hypothetical protein LBT48_03890 [Prevotellaceae bacterium]|jgi:hypothetical protein|nr:hypothetical protein [Prevotellaceae bacterium]
MRTPFFKFLFGALVAVSVFSAAVMWLWNVLIPDIFGLTPISFWQALGLLILARLFFSGFGYGRKFGGGFDKNRLRKKWQKMTPEERLQFVKNNHRHFGGFGGFRHGCESHSSDENDTQEKQD